MSEPASAEVTIERKQADLPRYVVLPFDPEALWGMKGLFVADGDLGGVAFQRRSVQPWGDGVRWFMGVTEPMCRQGGFDTGDRVSLTLRPTPGGPPAELAERPAADPAFAAAWSRFTPAHHREWSRWVAEQVKREGK